jgi:hypothetical protein
MSSEKTVVEEEKKDDNEDGLIFSEKLQKRAIKIMFGGGGEKNECQHLQ